MCTSPSPQQSYITSLLHIAMVKQLHCQLFFPTPSSPSPSFDVKLRGRSKVQVGKAWLLLSRAYQAEAADGAPEHATSAHQALIRFATLRTHLLAPSSRNYIFAAPPHLSPVSANLIACARQTCFQCLTLFSQVLPSYDVLFCACVLVHHVYGSKACHHRQLQLGSKCGVF